MVNKEIQLFILGIKPAILYPEKIIKPLNQSNCYSTRFRRGLILSHKELPNITDYDNIEVGKILGYYPEACELLYNQRIQEIDEVNEMIDFGGIKFNTAKLFNESLEWCIREYKDKMLEHYAKIEVLQLRLKREGKHLRKETVKTIIISR